MSDATFDPYQRSADAVVEPPQTFLEIVKQIGPGLILAASIVGTGELINTTLLGAKAGYALLWLMLLSCFVKVFVQIELGRYALASGKTTLTMIKEVPKVGAFFTWAWLIMMFATQNQIGVMIGGTGYTLAKMLGFENSTTLFAVIITFLTIVLLVRGSYGLIERLTTMLVGLFTLITVLCVIFILKTPQAFTWADIGEGMQFTFPAGAMVIALSAIGITGVGASELVAYPYWCLEKGYALRVGPTEQTEQWENRAKGWLRVMKVDAWLSMVVYTLATIAFYLLGAATLQGKSPSEMEALQKIDNLIPTLGEMYQPVLGEQGAIIFITIGAFIVLYSTLFAATAGNSRISADFLHVNHFVRFQNHQERTKWVSICCVFFPILGLALFLLIDKAALMVFIGGIAQAMMLPVLGLVAVYLRYKRVDRRLTPGVIWTFFLWLSLSFFLIAAAVGFWKTVSSLWK